MRAAALALGLAVAAAWLLRADIDPLSFITSTQAQPAALTEVQAQAQAQALHAYDKALRDFKAILAKRRAQIAAKKKLPGRPSTSPASR